MSDSQEKVRNLFNLKREEKILDDFGCSLSEKLPIPGRLYLTEHYICFDSNIFVFNRKYSIGFNELISLKKKKSNIEVKTKSCKKNKFIFSSFADINIVYKRIKSMCRSYNETFPSDNSETKGKEVINPILLSDSEDSDDDDNDYIIKTEDSSGSKKNSLDSSFNESSAISQIENKSEDITNATFSNSNNNIIVLSNNNTEVKINLLSSKTMNDLSLNDDLEGEMANNTNDNTMNSNAGRKKSSKLLTNKINSPKRKEFINSNIIEDEEIIFNPIDQDIDFEICRKIIDICPKQFFEKYFTNNYPETSYKRYYEWVGDYTEINVPNWEKIENPENPEIEKFQRIETFCLALHGVPLINKSNVIKTLTYWVNKEGIYYIKTTSKSRGVPLSDNFLVETTLEFHPYMNNTKTVFRTFVRTIILKSTLFKYALISQSKKSYEQEITKWLQFIGENGEKIEGDYVYKPKKRKNSFGEKHKALSHGIEKENSQMKNDKHIVEFSDFCEDIYNGTIKYTKLAYDYFQREFDKKTRIILICFFIIFILLFYILHIQSNEIKELKYGFNEMRAILDNLTDLTLELKNEFSN